MGFTAIQISPIVDNTDGGYHGYHARNWEKLNSNFGSPEDLHALVKACHDKDMFVMFDVVANHVGPIENEDYSQNYPFYNRGFYHIKCNISYDDQDSVETCWLKDDKDDQNSPSMPDLAQGD